MPADVMRVAGAPCCHGVVLRAATPPGSAPVVVLCEAIDEPQGTLALADIGRRMTRRRTVSRAPGASPTSQIRGWLPLVARSSRPTSTALLATDDPVASDA